MATRKKPKCDKGQPCGYGCIETVDLCTQKLEEVSSKTLEQYASLLQKLGKSDASREQIDKLNKAANTLLSLAGKIDEKGGFIKDEEANRQLVTQEEASKLSARQSILKEGQTALIIQEAQALGEGPWDWSDAELVYKLLPAKARKQLKESGQASANGWYNPNVPGEIDEPKKTATDARGIYVMKMWLDQAGRDAYTLGKQSFSPVDMDVEHITPLSKGGRDHPDNWVLIRAGLNRNRGNTDLPDFTEKAKQYASMSPEEYRTKIVEPAAKQRGGSDAARAAAESFQGNADDFANASAKLKKYVAQGLGFRNIGERIGRSGGMDAPTPIRDAFAQQALSGDAEKANSNFKNVQAVWAEMRNGNISNVEAAKQIAKLANETGYLKSSEQDFATKLAAQWAKSFTGRIKIG